MLNSYDYFFRLYLGAMHFFKKMNIGSLDIGDYLGMLSFVYYHYFPFFFPQFMFAYLLYLQQLELYSLPQILFVPYRYKRPSEGKSRLPFWGYKPRDGLINLICVSAGA